MLDSNCLERVQGFVFHKYFRTNNNASPSDTLKRLFFQLLPYVNGDAQEAIHWLNELIENIILPLRPMAWRILSKNSNRKG